MATTFAIARALHILFAILWVGGAIYATRIHLPLIREAQEYALRFYAKSKHDAWMGLTATGTMVFGGIVLLLNRDGYGSEIIGMGGAALMGLGMTASMVAYGIGILVHVPNSRKLRVAASAIRSGDGSQQASFDSLVARDNRFSMISAGLVGAAMLCMVSFRLFV